MPGHPPPRGLLFDKDGTLFDFQATWGVWTARVVARLAADDGSRRAALAEAIGFDLATRRFDRSSPVIAGTLEDLMEVWMPLLPDRTAGELGAWLVEQSRRLQPVEATPLRPLLEGLRARGLVLGVATNDAETAALSQLAKVGLSDLFAFVAGADSGHGAKPDPGPCRAFAEAFGLAGGEAVMVGDSLHDLRAGAGAGMRTIAVLTGVATAEDLGPHAEAVLPDIGHLPRWLGP